MIITKTILAASLLASPLVQATSVDNSKRGSFKLPLTRRVSKTTDDVGLTNIYSKTDWTTFVQFGNQNFSLQVDTGSSDIWVLSTLMSKTDQAQFPSNHFFDPTKSSTFKQVNGAQFNITYDAGEIFGAGQVGTDNVQIGSASVNMPFGVATQCSPQGMVDTMYDGMLGLAFGAGNTIEPTQGPTFMEAVQSQLDEPVFTFSLPDSSTGQMIEFGHVDQSLYNGTLVTAAISNGTSNSPMGWMATVSYSVGGKNISSAQQQTMFDTGGLEAQGSGDAVKAYWSLVQGSKDTSQASDGTGWIFPCSTSSLPDLTYNFVTSNGKTASATVPGKFFNASTTDADPSMCSGGFQSSGNARGTVGYAFFHSQFTVYNQSAPSVSFAPYPEQVLDGDNSVATVSGSTTVSTSTDGFKTRPTITGTATGTQVSRTATATATTTGGSGAAASSAGHSGAASAALPTASDSAPGGSGSSTGSIMQISSMAMALVAGVVAMLL